MAVTALVFGSMVSKALNKEIDWDSDTFKIALLTSTAAPNQDTWDYYDDLTNQVAATGGYSTGGATLASVTIGYTSGTNVVKLDAADVSWAASTITARYAVIYDDTPGTAATKPLICYTDFGADIISSGGSFDIVFNAAGIVTFTVA